MPKERWSPEWCKHAVGEYDMPRTFNDDGLPEPQYIVMHCEHPDCANKPRPHYRIPCTSGNVRQHIAKFALVHLHRDPMQGAK